MDKLKRMFIWLRRCRYSRGFGIQSPWAYQFVRYVVNEHYPYYSYAELKTLFPEVDVTERKKLELYFRLANFRQPKQILYCGNDYDTFSTYCKHGCHHSEVLTIDQSSIIKLSNIQMLCLTSLTDYHEVIARALQFVDSDSIIVVEGINETKNSRKEWKKLTSDERTGIVFDLYYCGIIFFDKKRYKEKYNINF